MRDKGVLQVSHLAPKEKVKLGLLFSLCNVVEWKGMEMLEKYPQSNRKWGCAGYGDQCL